jgi:hypothetical protein
MQRQSYQRIEIRPLGWRGMLGLGIAVTTAVALILTFGLIFLLLLPVILVAGLVARWWLGRELRRAARDGHDRAVIEAEYEVVEAEALEPPRGSWGPRR